MICRDINTDKQTTIHQDIGYPDIETNIQTETDRNPDRHLNTSRQIEIETDIHPDIKTPTQTYILTSKHPDIHAHIQTDIKIDIQTQRNQDR